MPLYFQTWGYLGMQDYKMGTPGRCLHHRAWHTQIAMSRRHEGVTVLIYMAAMSPSFQLVTGCFKSLTRSLGESLSHSPSPWKVLCYRVEFH